ncbi:hypothetical protein ACOSQ2_013526 [Xanthoceras sorbifolium]
MTAHYCSLIIHVDDRVYLNYPKSPLKVIPVTLVTWPSRESKSRLPLESCEIGFRDLATQGQNICLRDLAKSQWQLACGSRLLKMLGLRDLSSS